MMISFTWTNKYKINIIASNHSDGRFGALVGRFFKLNNIPRSSKNSNASLKIIYKLVKNNEYIGITPDGPRGPKMKINSAIIKIASLTGFKILPLSCSVKNKFFLKSWDKYLVALPFGKGCFAWGEPLKIKKKITKEEDLKLSNKLEKILLKLTKEADHYCN